MSSRPQHRPRSLAAAFLATGAMLAAGSLTASASPGQTARVDVTGAVFSCTDGSYYTVTSGDALFLNHESTDANGGFHVTGTVAPRQVTLAFSGDAKTYYLAGASWFGGNFGAGGGEMTDTEHFQIRAASGGTVDDVSIVTHFTVNANGDVTVSFDKESGTCQPPQD
ncbi:MULTISPECIES: hypothetical protein [Kribbella]|uniref:hypothetical protein n=1 Tax=Kribbella TaxID=182639 RepID=UPI002F4B0BDD